MVDVVTRSTSLALAKPSVTESRQSGMPVPSACGTRLEPRLMPDLGVRTCREGRAQSRRYARGVGEIEHGQMKLICVRATTIGADETVSAASLGGMRYSQRGCVPIETSVAPQLIFDLLGLPADTDVEHLRHAYEGAVGAATARGDWMCATELSRAFDQLPRQVRLAMYSGRDRDAPRWTSGKQHHTSRTRRLRRSRPGRSGRMRRILLAGVSAILSLVAVESWLIPHPPTNPPVATLAGPAAVPMPTPIPASHSPRRSRRHTHRPFRPLKATWSPMRALYPGSGEVRIPAHAIVDASGHTHVLCPNRANGSAWRRVTAMPGQYFTCPSGYVGVVLVRSR